MARGLVVFDLDGTLLRQFTVCELIAASIGKADQMRVLESRSGRAAVAESRATMLRWYAPYSREALTAPLASASWAPGARESVETLRDADVCVAIASVTWHFAVEWFASSLGIRNFLGTSYTQDGAIHHVWPEDKGEWSRNLALVNGIPEGRIAAVGDSEGDYDLLRAASMRFFVGASPPTLEGIIHLQGADLRSITQRLLSAWSA